jgi:rRNA-processing protein FCF1
MSVDEYDEEQELQHVKKKISVDNLVQDVEASSDSLFLKEKLQALAQEASSSLSKNLILGKTVLVFDTNIFLRGISGISGIIESKKYPVIVPLPVITELTGISGNDDLIGSHALEALEYLKTAISARKFRIQTAKGSFVDSMSNISETWDTKYTNADDVILDICRMHKNVCLITDDANLRLKCRTVGVLCLDSIYKIRP